MHHLALFLATNIGIFSGTNALTLYGHSKYFASAKHKWMLHFNDGIVVNYDENDTPNLCNSGFKYLFESKKDTGSWVCSS